MDDNNAIEIRNLKKSFDYLQYQPDKTLARSLGRRATKVTKIVFDSLTINFRKGEVVGILGRNGSGKSTLLKLISKIIEPDEGTIEYYGKVATILELGMGFHRDMSGRENIYIKGEMYGFSKTQMDGMIEGIIDYSGIREYIDTPVRTYSSGMVGRLAFAIMTHVDAEIVLVDEVLSTGDVAFAAKAKEHFREMTKHGRTVIFVSHNINTIQDLCTRAVWIESGKVRADGPVRMVSAKYLNAMANDPDIIKDLAKSGVAEYQYKLALLYRDGTTLPKDEKLFLEWLKKSANGKYARAEVEYADILMKKDKDSALQFYVDAAERGNKEARTKLAILTSDDDTLSLIDRLRKHYRSMAEKDDLIFQYRYAELLQKTAWTREDLKESFEWFKKAADNGHPDAMHQVAIMYREGIGTKKDTVEMERYLRMASDKGFLKSITLLADCYFKGEIVPNDDTRAFELFSKAASLGDGNSMFRVATMYTKGIGTKIDRDMANTYHRKYVQSTLKNHITWMEDRLMTSDDDDYAELRRSASEYNDVSSIMTTIISYGMGGVTKEEYESSINKMKILAENGNLDAATKLGNMYHNGICVEKDDYEAKKWYTMGAEKNSSWCMEKLAEIYNGMDKKNEAIELYFTAAERGRTYCLKNILSMSTDKYVNERALAMLVNSANKGKVESMTILGDIYHNGIYVGKDPERANHWFGKGAERGDNHCRNMIGKMEKK